MRNRRFRPWRRLVAYLRAKRVLRVTVEYEYVCVPQPVEIDPRLRRHDLTGLDEAERADWGRFMQMTNEQLVQEPDFSRFLAVKDKVRWVLIDPDEESPEASPNAGYTRQWSAARRDGS